MKIVLLKHRKGFSTYDPRTPVEPSPLQWKLSRPIFGRPQKSPDVRGEPPKEPKQHLIFAEMEADRDAAENVKQRPEQLVKGVLVLVVLAVAMACTGLTIYGACYFASHQSEILRPSTHPSYDPNDDVKPR